MSKPKTIYEMNDQLLAERDHLRALNAGLLAALEALEDWVCLKGYHVHVAALPCEDTDCQVRQARAAIAAAEK